MMIEKKSETIFTPKETSLSLPINMQVCQTDYPFDWYQEEFMPYAEAYLALPDRDLLTTLAWMKPYMEKAQKHFGDELLLLAHYYMGGDIVKIIEYFGGVIGDSYQLALMAVKHPERKVIVESAVHFMAESISILAHPDQSVYITNPKAGCTMEMLAKDFMVSPALTALNERYGAENIMPICYMNTSGRVKAMTGAQGGSVCTSSNVKKIFQWALAHNKKILFIPDRHMGENVASWLNIPREKIAYWPAGAAALEFKLEAQSDRIQKNFDEATLVLFSSECGVHSYYEKDMVTYWQAQGYHVLVHPECRNEVVLAADGCGSTAFLWDQVMHDRAGTQKYAIGTENHMVKNLRAMASKNNVQVVNISEMPGLQKLRGCGCATMSRNDPPHLIATLDLLRQGKIPEYNLVKSGDVVNEFSGARERLDMQGQDWIRNHAREALERMISITEA